MFSAASFTSCSELTRRFRGADVRISDAFHFPNFFQVGAPSLFSGGGRSAQYARPLPPPPPQETPGAPFFKHRQFPRFLHSQQWRSGAGRARPGSSQSAIGSSTSSAARFSS